MRWRHLSPPETRTTEEEREGERERESVRERAKEPEDCGGGGVGAGCEGEEWGVGVSEGGGDGWLTVLTLNILTRQAWLRVGLIGTDAPRCRPCDAEVHSGKKHRRASERRHSAEARYSLSPASPLSQEARIGKWGLTYQDE